MLPFPSTESNSGFFDWSQLHYQLSQTLRSLMAVVAYTSGFSALVWMNTGMFRLSNIYLEVPKDSAFISNKSCFDRCWHGWDTGVTVRQTDRWLFSFIYIDTVGPWLARISIIRTLGYPNTISNFKILWFSTINGMPVWFLELLGLLYHSAVGRKA